MSECKSLKKKAECLKAATILSSDHRQKHEMKHHASFRNSQNILVELAKMNLDKKLKPYFCFIVLKLDKVTKSIHSPTRGKIRDLSPGKYFSRTALF